jgi:glycosyltransferase involved in cell wall biosynthesis
MGAKVWLLTFEKGPKDGKQRQQRERLAQEGIHWRWLRYHKTLPLAATLYDILRGALLAAWVTWRKGIQVIEARGTLPAAMGYGVARALRRPFLFNVRALLAEEYADAGRWSRRSLRFRVISWLERRCLARAEAVIVLTEALRQLLASGDFLSPPRREGITVIPCCVDLQKFSPASTPPGPGPIFVYAGSLGGYYLTEELVAFFRSALNVFAQARLLLLSNGYDDLAREAISSAGAPADRIEVRSVSHEAIPGYLRHADVGLIFARPSFARIGMSPTKLAEYLACGLPVVITPGIGDTEEVVRGQRVGVVLPALDEAGFLQAAEEIRNLRAEGDTLARRCRKVAEEFGLETGLTRYREVYRHLGF